MGDQPLDVHAVPMKTTTNLVIHATDGHSIQRVQDGGADSRTSQAASISRSRITGIGNLFGPPEYPACVSSYASISCETVASTSFRPTGTAAGRTLNSSMMACATF